MFYSFGTMISMADSTFTHLYRKRFLRAVNSLKKHTSSNNQGDGDEATEVTGSCRNIKLATDVSLALTANHAAWGRALLNRISRDENNRPALRKILGSKNTRAVIAEMARNQSRLMLQSKLKQFRIKQHRSSGAMRSSSHRLSLYRYFCRNRTDPSTSFHASLVNKRTRKLQRVVPGGISMDTTCLLRETADYIKSLTTQVEVLQSLLNSVNYNRHSVL